ncbi:MAG: 4-amino-4-deoxy-L-arabinose transferase [Nocardioidaceae bacterium]
MSGHPPEVGPVADALLTRVLAQPATLGSGRLLCVDGPSGAGKTTLAAAVRRAARRRDIDVAVLHMDAVYDGWEGLAAGMATVARDVVAPLRAGRPGHYRRYDWHRGRFAEGHEVRPRALLVVEGVGAGNPAYADATTLLVWCDAPAGLRLERALARDGVESRERLLAWHAREQEMFARERVRERADVLLGPCGSSAPGAG